MLRNYLLLKFVESYSSFEEAENVLKTNPKAFYDFTLKLLSDISKGIILNSSTADELYNMIKSGKISLIMDENDKDVLGIDRFVYGKEVAFNELSDIALVHKTSIMPTDDTILTKEDNGVKKSILFINAESSEKEEHCVEFLSGNDTIHFTLNSAVENHEFGNDWDSYKYGILTFLSDDNKDQILDMKSEDTFFDGSVSLTGEHYIFCPYGERNEIKKANPHAIVIEYKPGITLSEAINSFITYTGRKYKKYGSFGWGKEFDLPINDSDEKYLDAIAERENIPRMPGRLHSETEYMARRMWKTEYRAYIALIEYLINNNINMPRELYSSILLYNGCYSIPGNVPCTIELYKKYVIPILEEHGYDIPSNFFDGIEEDGTLKIVDTTGDYPAVYSPRFESILRERVIDLIISRNLGRGVK